MKCGLALMLFCSTALGQQHATSATTSAPCSPIAPNNSGTITINCPDTAKRDAIINLLKQNDGDVKRTLNKVASQDRPANGATW